MDPVTVATVAGAVKPETLDAAGGVVEKTGKGIGHVFTSIGSMGTEHHKIAKDAENERLRILAGMDPEQLELVLKSEHDRAAQGKKNMLTKVALASTPLGLLSMATDLRSPAFV